MRQRMDQCEKEQNMSNLRLYNRVSIDEKAETETLLKLHQKNVFQTEKLLIKEKSLVQDKSSVCFVFFLLCIAGKNSFTVIKLLLGRLDCLAA